MINFRSFRARLSVCLTLAVLALTGAVFATETNATMATISTATVTQLTTVQQALLNLISQILPVALTVAGSVLVVSLGIRLFRKFAG